MFVFFMIFLILVHKILAHKFILFLSYIFAFHVSYFLYVSFLIISESFDASFGSLLFFLCYNTVSPSSFFFFLLFLCLCPPGFTVFPFLFVPISSVSVTIIIFVSAQHGFVHLFFVNLYIFCEHYEISTEHQLKFQQYESQILFCSLCIVMRIIFLPGG